MACVVSLALAQQRTTMIAIDKMNVGMPPADFDFARTGQGGPGQWAVVADTTASGGRAIEQTSTDRTDYRFPLAIHRAVSARNVEVSLRFKAIAGAVDRAGGIALRVLDADNYYVVRANALEDNVRFYRVVKGRREQIEGSNIKVSAERMAGALTQGRRRALHRHLQRQAAVHRHGSDLRGPRQDRALDQG